MLHQLNCYFDLNLIDRSVYLVDPYVSRRLLSGVQFGTEFVCHPNT